MAKHGVQITVAIVVVAAALTIGRGSEPAVDSPTGDGQTVGFRPAEIDLGNQLWGTIVPVELTFAIDSSPRKNSPTSVRFPLERVAPCITSTEYPRY